MILSKKRFPITPLHPLMLNGLVCNNEVECFKHLVVSLSSDFSWDSCCDCIVCRIQGNTVSHTYICCIWGHICPVTSLSTVLIGVTTPCIFYATFSWPVCLFILKWPKEWCLATLAWAFLCLFLVPHRHNDGIYYNMWTHAIPKVWEWLTVVYMTLCYE